MRDGVHSLQFTAFSTLNAQLNEGASNSLAVNTYTFTKWQHDCELEFETLTTAAFEISVDPAFYRIGEAAWTASWGSFTTSPSDCNLIYSVESPTALAPYVTQTGLRSLSLNIPATDAQGAKIEVAGYYTFHVIGKTVKNLHESTIKSSFDLKVSDPDCETPNVSVTPTGGAGEAYDVHYLLSEADYVMWSFDISPSKCRPLMTYASSVHTTVLNQNNPTGLITSDTDKRIFRFPWNENTNDLGPYAIRVTASTLEGTEITNG
jgi:hypothetical protein